jgi:hypothetical protein
MFHFHEQDLQFIFNNLYRIALILFFEVTRDLIKRQKAKVARYLEINFNKK